MATKFLAGHEASRHAHQPIASRKAPPEPPAEPMVDTTPIATGIIEVRAPVSAGEVLELDTDGFVYRLDRLEDDVADAIKLGLNAIAAALREKHGDTIEVWVR